MTEYKTKQQKRKFYKSTSWKHLRQQALERDNWECQRCKELGKVHVDSKKVQGEKKSIELNVHHVKEIYHHPELALELDNLKTLCLNCHNEIHGRVFNKEKEMKWDDERW
jgi:5-methylcytosine-specific restriction endonuclease McrA